MILTLMHQDLSVADLEYDEAGGTFTKILQVHHLEHFPVGIVHKHIVDRGSLNRWWRDRAIPATRAGFRDALEKLGVNSSEELLEKCYGLSLSDQYWIQPWDLKLSWEQINFFDNPFSPDVGNVLLGQHPSGKLSLMSPDNSSDGWLKKRWTILDGKRCLMKGGSGTVQQEPYNEVMASRIMERLGISHVHYDLTVQNGLPYSVCEDFITRDTELVPAHRLIQTQKQLNSRSDYQHFLLCCQCCGLPDPTAFLDQMMTVDYLMANVDRHYNNFGAIRDAESLKYLGMAPIYDNGTSLWYDTPTARIDAGAEDIPARPFKGTQGQQIRLVTSFDWIKPDALYGLGDELHDILKDSGTVDMERRDVLCRALNWRGELLRQEMASRTFQNTPQPQVSATQDWEPEL